MTGSEVLVDLSAIRFLLTANRGLALEKSGKQNTTYGENLEKLLRKVFFLYLTPDELKSELKSQLLYEITLCTETRG